ncbi:spore germination protein [Paenibacillus sp. UNC499MF]|uniref:spore germination protein n=1 Tax=Paenibacillus sp. UNC499MF TaxID=1502751 RepID=UPI0021561C26|nr:spore germination protein [Paenibacillus sp. UNC499MF]
MSLYRKLLRAARSPGQGDHLTDPDPLKAPPASDSIAVNIGYLQHALCHTEDLKRQPLPFAGRDGTLVYLESLVDQDKIQLHVVQPLHENTSQELDNLFNILETTRETPLDNAVKALIQGKCVYFLEGLQGFYILATEAVYKRSVEEPQNEGVIRGPHYGFIEVLNVNLFLIRKLISSPYLTVRYFLAGTHTQTRIAVVYMKNIANDELVREVEERIRAISADAVLTTGIVQEITEDHPFSMFPQHLATERPDRTASSLMEGRVAIITDGSPTVLIAPVTFFAFYQSPDDYNGRWIVSSFVRMIRMFSFLLAFTLPALYIGTVSFHPDILPLELVHTIKSSLERVPFPAIVEAMLLELIFELLREAGIRLPSRVGQTIGIVGGLVIGDAIVRAGLVSYTMIIVVSLTAIASFLVPSHEMSSAVRILRFPLMIAASIFGYVGIAFGLMLLTIHLCKLESFGTPYFSPFAPLRIKDMKDVLVRFPSWLLNARPHDADPKFMKQEEATSRSWKRDED